MQARLDVRDGILYAVGGEKVACALYRVAAARGSRSEVARVLHRLAPDEWRHPWTVAKRCDALDALLVDDCRAH